MAMLETKKDQWHRFIDSIPDEKLPKLFDLFLDMIEEEIEELTEEEKQAIEQAEEEFKRGETYSFEEVFGEDE